MPAGPASCSAVLEACAPRPHPARTDGGDRRGGAQPRTQSARTSAAVVQSSAVTSRWVTARNRARREGHDEHAVLARAARRRSRRPARRREPEDDDVRLQPVEVELTPSTAASRSPMTRALAWSVGQPLDVVVEGVQAGGGEHPRLAHRAAEHAPVAHERGDVLAVPASTEPPGSRVPSRARSDEVERRGERRRVVAARDRGVQQPRAVEVGATPCSRAAAPDALELPAVPDEPALAVLGVLDLDQRRRREEQVPARLASRRGFARGERAVAADLGELDARRSPRRAGLVPDGVALARRRSPRRRAGRRASARAGWPSCPWDEQRRLLAEQGGDALLEAITAGPRRTGRRRPRPRRSRARIAARRPRDRVRAQVDHRGQPH